MPWRGAPSREGRSTPLRSIRLDLARELRGPGSLATSSSWTPIVPRPPGLAAPQAQEQTTAPGPEDPNGQGATGQACPAQDDAHGGPRRDAGDPSTDVTQEQHGRGSAHACEQDGKPQDIRAFLGLGPAERNPIACRGLRTEHAKQGSRGSPRQSGPQAGRPASGPANLGPCTSPPGTQGPRGVTGVTTAPDGTRELPGKPQDQAPGYCWSVSGCSTGLQQASWRPPVVPGSSTDPPSLHPAGYWRALGPHPWRPGYRPRGPAGSPASSPRLWPEQPGAPGE